MASIATMMMDGDSRRFAREALKYVGHKEVFRIDGQVRKQAAPKFERFAREILEREHDAKMRFLAQRLLEYLQGVNKAS